MPQVPPWDESTRPTYTAPQQPGEAAYAGHGRHLVDIHDHLRAELAQVRDVLEQVRRGRLAVGAARSAVNAMTVRQHDWSLGAYCQAYCRVVTGHHSIEDASVFPHLRRSEPGLGPVLDRLHEEHEVVHGVLERLDRALVALVADDEDGLDGVDGVDGLDGVGDALDLLADTLLSHLAYEERELVGPLSRHGLH